MNESMKKAYEEIARQNKWRKEHWYERRAIATDDIERVTGKREKFTFEDAMKFIDNKYGARILTTEEVFEYIPNKYHIVEHCKRRDDPIGNLTEGQVCNGHPYYILLLPPKQEQVFNMFAPKNGCVVILQEEDGLITYWWVGGNTSGYKPMYIELDILCGLDPGKRIFK